MVHMRGNGAYVPWGNVPLDSGGISVQVTARNHCGSRKRQEKKKWGKG